MNSLYLVGTVHFDIDGKQRLDTLLNRLSPSIVALEFSKDKEPSGPSKTLEEKQREFSKLMDESGLNLNQKQRETVLEFERRYRDLSGYEFFSARDYTQRNQGSRLEYIDISLFDTGGREEYTNYIKRTFKDLAKLISQEPESAQSFLQSLNDIDQYVEFIRTSTQTLYQSGEVVEALFEVFHKVIQSPELLEMIKEHLSAEQVEFIKKVVNPKRDEVMSARIRELYHGSTLVGIVGLGHLTGIKSRIKDLNPRVITLADYNSL